MSVQLASEGVKMADRIASIMADFAAAKTATEYRAAKRRASCLPVVSQLAMVDTIMAASKRLRSEGVLS